MQFEAIPILGSLNLIQQFFGSFPDCDAHNLCYRYPTLLVSDLGPPSNNVKKTAVLRELNRWHLYKKVPQN